MHPNIRLLPLSLLLLALVTGACSRGPKEVDPALRPYLKQFLVEASERKIPVDVNGLVLRFTPELIRVEGQAFCGYAWSFGSRRPPFVEIARPCWSAYTAEEREALVYHELGHALLQRRHRDDHLPNGSLASLMNSRSEFRLYSPFTPAKRGYYLDELFLSAAADLPDWARTHSEILAANLSPASPADTAWTLVGAGAAEGAFGGADAASRAYALFLSAPAGAPLPAAASWRRIISHPKIAVGAQLSLRVRVRLREVTGPGVALAVRGANFGASDTRLSAATAREANISGTLPSLDLSLNVTDYFPDGVNALYIYLMLLPGSTGEVYFEEVLLEQRR